MSTALSSGAVAPRRARIPAQPPAIWVLWLGAASLIIPTIIDLAQQYWSIEEGSHGPIVLATGLWLLIRSRDDIYAIAERGKLAPSTAVFVISMLGYIFAHMTGMLGPQSVCVYVALVAILYLHVGWAAVRRLWFPLIYLLFMLPQPETLLLPLTHALKLGLSTAAVYLLSSLGYAVGHGGVVLYVDQYELLVASACSGMNSLIGLGAIGVFYAYLRYNGDWRAAAPLLFAIIPIALTANFVRVVLLLLVTHYLGMGMTQEYIHDLAGIIMFAIAVALLLGADEVLSRMRQRMMRRHAK